MSRASLEKAVERHMQAIRDGRISFDPDPALEARAPADPALQARREREQLLRDFFALPDADEFEPLRHDLITHLAEAEVSMVRATPTRLAGALAQLEQLALWIRDGEPGRGGEAAIDDLIKVLPDRIALLQSVAFLSRRAAP